ncbi:hypothetical protein ABIC37_005445 [Priestia megaterium]|uniref:hypothetical protein n=1 Tax=Priestia megaterium TaxID=1404 RepID=UPI00339AC877
MEELLNRLDDKKIIGKVTLTDGGKLNVPKLSLSKIIGIVKFIGTDGARLYADVRELLLDEGIDGIEKITLVMGGLEEKRLIRIFSILLDIEDEEALALDINEMLDVVLMYVEKTNIKKTFLQIRTLYKALYNKEMPTFKELMNDLFPPEEMDKMKEEMAKKANSQPATVPATASHGEE